MACPRHPQWPHHAKECPFCERPGDYVTGGQFFERTPAGMIPLGQEAPRQADAWVCRRVADFPGQRVPTGGLIGVCSDCGAAIVFNPDRLVAAPKVCMQCASIRPLPFES